MAFRKNRLLALFAWLTAMLVAFAACNTAPPAPHVGTYAPLPAGTITNLDTDFGHTPATVRFSSQGTVPALNGANETTAFYARVGNDVSLGTTFNYGIYGEVGPFQNYTSGGSFGKIIHRGHGDGWFVGLLNGITAKTITAMTGNGVSPIVVTIPSHGFGQGDIVQISTCSGNTAATGVWGGIIVIDANTFSLPSSTGNGTYVANSCSAQDIDPPVGYEGAQWGDGVTSFLASMQYPGGRANATFFNGLVQADAILNYGVFVANDTPNASLVANKRTGLADSAIDGLAQISIVESLRRMTSGNGGVTGGFQGTWSAATTYVAGQTVILGTEAYKCILGNTNQMPPNATYWTDVTDTTNVGRQRWAAFNSGETHLASLKSTSGTTTESSPELHMLGSYWNGSTSVDRDLIIKHEVTSTSPSSRLAFYIGPTGSETLLGYWQDNGILNLQNHNMTAVGNVQLQTGGAGSFDAQGGTLVNTTNVQSNTTAFVIYANSNSQMQLQDAPSSNSTSMLLRVNNNGGVNVAQVSLGAADSGGTGFRCLRVAN